MCDPMWHVSSRSGVVTLRTAIHLLLTYLLTYQERGAVTAILPVRLSVCHSLELSVCDNGAVIHQIANVVFTSSNVGKYI